MVNAILGFVWMILKGMAFLGGILVFFAFIGSFYKTFRRSFRDKWELERRMEEAWGGDGKKKRKNKR